MTTTPYSDQWRAHTRERMGRLHLSPSDVADATGLALEQVVMHLREFDVSLEFASVIDELLDAREQGRDARRLVAFECGPLLDCTIHLTRRP